MSAPSTASPNPTDAAPRHIVIVGGGPAAHRLTEALVSRELPGTRISVFTEEALPPYDRVGLSKRFATDDDLLLGEPGLWESPSLTLHTSRAVTGLDTAAQTITTADGETLGYDELVLATGSSAPRPGLEGAEQIAVYRTLDDVDWLRLRVAELGVELGRTPKCAVIGGGLLGLEAAGGLKGLGAEVTVVHSKRWLMNAQLDEFGGRTLNRLLEKEGYDLHCGERPAGLEIRDAAAETSAAPGAGSAQPRYALTFPTLDTVEADLIVAAIGITARDELARDAGLQLGSRGGAVIDATCATSADHVWAIGEVACFEDICMGLVAPANAMAEVVADRLAGGAAEFDGFDTAAKLKLAGMDVASFGDGFAETEGALEVVYADPADGVYQKLVVSDDARTLLGGIFVGDASPYSSLRPLLGRELPAEPGAFLSAAGGDVAELELPDDAQVCSCKDICAGTLRKAVAGDGATPPCADIGALKKCTKVGTQCGSCLPMAKKIMEKEMVAQGMEVSHALCEHFDLSRAELFEAVQATGLSSFTEIIERFGTPADPSVNFGCDICKPVIASVLAAQHDEYILDGGRGALQDTNDRALANMQKDGTYSVVPRVPAGEITPAKLAAIAEVAQEFDLYTKITGAQRIDMFGARLEQLPMIWRKLVDAGFESGQAYGKALRNVKSCVGSTWCRYGVQDSVAMAIELEMRYRGLRSPHKLKFGVSGCARECAEARGKDVGVIATSEGWNLYVGGNGGATPAHAELLAKDLDDETLLRYIDRYIIYYVRTADRLQRTARWMEELPGGVEHIHDVVVKDTLGVAEDLEAAMATHVDRYEDEWAATLRDPEKLRRFRSFVNAPDAPDTGLAYVLERDQRRPATEEERVAAAAGEGPVLLSGPRIPVRESFALSRTDVARADVTPAGVPS
ncbi:nitrite reductase large subunit NirB [Nesterenkonia sp. HG001]|uniref:nitrite reductase large subunit NirB n=1 Tax=Nesterenkonia sp. HG001 TaxID=2983207 RepID=UPI002AC3B621|nr:nitrite reductase large subunit NirB [Nesterenkonia sp. HG001]MDZ5077588.1 nitrite reductase large subunit NirB [Nesterenkonia sp. HG001]